MENWKSIFRVGFEGRLYLVFAHLNKFYQIGKKTEEVKKISMSKILKSANGRIILEFQGKGLFFSSQ